MPLPPETPSTSAATATSPSTETPPTRPSRRWRRRILLVLVATLLLACTAVLILLKTSFGREQITRRVVAEAEQQTGLQIRLTSWDLSLTGRRFQIRELEVMTPEGELLASVEKVDVVVALRSLLSSDIRVPSIVIETPFVDLNHLDSLPASDEQEQLPSTRTVTAERIEVRDGRVRGIAQDLDLGQGLERVDWSVEDVSIGGGFSTKPDGPIEIKLEGDIAATAESLLDPRLRFDLTASGSLDTLQIEPSTLTGNGVRFQGSGLVRPTSGQSRFEFETQIEPAQLLRVAAPESYLTAEGAVDLGSRTAQLQAAAKRVPISLFAGPGSESIELDASLHFASTGESTDVLVETNGSLRKGTQTLATFELDADGQRDPGEAGASAWVDTKSLAAEGSLAAVKLPISSLRPMIPKDTLSQLDAVSLGRGMATANATFSVAPGQETAKAALTAQVTGSDGSRINLDVDDLNLAVLDGAPDIGSLSGDFSVQAAGLRSNSLSQLIEAIQPGQMKELQQDLASSDDLLEAQAAGSIRQMEIQPGLKARMNWQLEDGPALFEATLDVTRGGSAKALNAAIVAKVLNSRPGARDLTANVEIPSLEDLQLATLGRSDLTIDEPNLESLLSRLRERFPQTLQAVAHPALTGSANLDLEASGTATDPEIAGTFSWQPAGSGTQPWLDGRLEARPLAKAGTLTAAFDVADLGQLEELGFLPEAEADPDRVPWGGEFRATLVASAVPVTDGSTLSARVEATALPLRVPDVPQLNTAALRAELLPGALWSEDGIGIPGVLIEELSLGGPQGWTRVSGSLIPPGVASSGPEAELRLEGAMPEFQLTTTTDITLREARLRAVSRELESSSGGGSFEAEMSLGALYGAEGLAAFEETLRAWGIAPRDEPATIRAFLPDFKLTSGDGPEGPPIPGTTPPLPTWAARAEGLTADLALNLQNPARSEINIRLEAGEFDQGTTPIRLAEPMELVLRERRATIPSTTLEVGEETLSIAGEAQLGAWDSSDPQSLVESLKAQAQGTFDTKFLTPFLAGGTATGPAELSLQAAGDLETLTADISLQAPDASFQFTSPYATKVDDLKLEARLDDGTLILDEATASLNRGTLALKGRADPEGDLDLDVQLADVRYRVDYGLSTQISGDLALNMPLGEQLMTGGRLSGSVVLERGLLRRNINLEREALAILMPQSTALGADDPFARAFELDLSVATRKGVRVRNNVADMRLFWSPLRIRGSLAEPLIDGVLDAEPGGLITVYGQTVRLDQATVTLRGQPGAQPSLDLVTTTSLEDPSVVRRSGRGDLDPFAQPVDPEDQQSATDRAAGGLAQYVGDRLLGGGSGGLQIGNAFSVKPIIVLTETEPSARLLVSRRLSEQLDLGAAFDMRNTEDRTYLIDVHDVPWFPSLSGQVFTNEDREEGVTVQQVLQLGGGPTDQRRVGKVRVQKIGKGPKTKLLQKATGVSRGDPWTDDLEFDVEIDIEEYLRRRGFPSPTVRVEVSERGLRRDLLIELEAGTSATFEFEGIKIPRKLRDPLRWIYRTDFYETASLREMEEQTRRALLGEGWLSPKVQATASVQPDGSRAVVINSQSDLQIGEPSLVADLPLEAQEVANGTLTGRGAIATLLSGDEGAERTLEGRFQRAGWASARFLEFELQADGKQARLEMELGPRTQVGEVTVSGAPTELLPQAEEVAVQTGSPYDQSLTTAYAAQIETGLRDRGYRNARVDIDPQVSGTTANITYRVETGLQFRVGQVNMGGGRNTNPKWASKVALIKEGDVLDSTLLSKSRRRLLSTGLFDTIYLETTKLEDGEIEVDVQLEERERWSLGYGLRWETAEGLGAVVDIRDQNFLGRGVQAGARALYTEDRESFRLYSTVPRVLGSGFSVETYAEVRNENDEGLLIDTTEASLQLSRPLSRRGTGRVYARYRNQQFSEEDPDPFFPLELKVRSPFLGVQYIWDNRADILSGSSGLFASADLSGSGDALGSDFDYLRFFGQIQLTRNAFRYGTKTATWAQSLRLGLAESGDDPLLRDLRFFAGGEYSVRGYRTESLGPIEDLGRIQRPLGGQALLVLNQELRLPVLPDLATVVFFDAGEVWELVDDFETRLRTSLGLGFRYRSPLGTLRLDVGFPLDRRDGDSSYRVYAGLGQVF